MDTIRPLLTMLLPILVTLGLGVIIRKTALLSREGIDALKKVVTRVTLPFVVFQAFYAMDYSMDALVTTLFVLAACLVLFALGYLFQKRFAHITSLLPFTLSGFEMGMLGYPLYLVMAGQTHMGKMAMSDLGQVVFVFTVYLFMLRRQTGQAQSPGKAGMDALKNPVLIAVALGLLVGVTGLGRFMRGTPAGEAVDAVCGFVSAPTAVLILLTIGYDLVFEPRMLKRAGLVVLLRLVLVGLVGGAMCLLLFRVIPFDPWLLLAILLMLSLPAPFVLPVYSQTRAEAEFVSVYLSLGTLVFVVLYAALLFLKPVITG